MNEKYKFDWIVLIVILASSKSILIYFRCEFRI